MAQVAFTRSFTISGFRSPGDLECALVGELTRLEHDVAILQTHLKIEANDREASALDYEVFIHAASRDFMSALQAAAFVADALTTIARRLVGGDAGAAISSPGTTAVRTELLEVRR
ncbi:hypothetical protein GCM10027568_28290 [Humibacter soli]